MPPRSAVANSSALVDAGNEVICPLKNNDGTNCRKRCFGEKRYRSMQEHIRRAHPDHYIPKLPANEESFLLMIKTAPSEKPKAPVDHVPKTSSLSDLFRHASPYADNVQASTYEPRGYRDFDMDEPIMPNSALRRPSMLPAATALADLHNARIDHDDWDTDQIVCDEPLAFYNGSSHLQDGLPQIESDTNYSLQTYLGGPLGQDAYRARMPDSPLPKNVSPTELMRQPLPLPNSSRASSAQPFPRVKVTKPRKASITEHARRGKHEREREREYKRFSHGPQDRHLKAPSVETSSLFGNKWEDLLEAAASASEADCRSRDLTPIPSPRPAFPPLHGLHQPHSYTASPLQNSILPRSPEEVSPRFEPPHLEPFPSVESTYEVHPPPLDQAFSHEHHLSNGSLSGHPYSPSHPYHFSHHNTNSSGSSYHLPPETISTSPETSNHRYSINNIPAYPSNTYSPPTSAHAQHPPPSPLLVQHYCAACHRVAPLTTSFACTECICGICRDCVEVLQTLESNRVARCPRCGVVGGSFKPFMLDLK